MKSVLIIFLTLILSCNRGLEPEEDKSNYLIGNLVITGGMIPDSASAIRIGAFKKQKLDSISEFIGEIISQNAYLSDTLSISSGLDTITFSVEIPVADITLNYIVASMEIDGFITNQILISIYDEDIQKSISFFEQETKEIELRVDFNNLPPQPF